MRRAGGPVNAARFAVYYSYKTHLDKNSREIMVTVR